MKVTINVSGGFAGLPRQQLKPIQTDRLDQQAADQIHKCIEVLTQLVAARKETPVGADMFQYEIEVEHDDGRQDRMIFTDEDDLTDSSFAILFEYAGSYP